MGGTISELSQAKHHQAHPTPSRRISNQINIYYSNCAMAVCSPRDIAVYFGRYVSARDGNENQHLAELYERQIYMTVEQARDLVRMLNQSIDALTHKDLELVASSQG